MVDGSKHIVMVSWFFMLFFMLIWMKFFWQKQRLYGLINESYNHVKVQSGCSQEFFALFDSYRSFIILNGMIVRQIAPLKKGA